MTRFRRMQPRSPDAEEQQARRISEQAADPDRATISGPAFDRGVAGLTARGSGERIHNQRRAADAAAPDRELVTF